MQNVLAIDTSTDACSIGLATQHGVTGLHQLLPRAHDKHIFSMIDDLLDQYPINAIDIFACGVGPGSFTGLRIAASITQGLAWSLDKLVLPMCSLENQAQVFAVENPRASGLVLSCIDAHIGQLYWRWFSCSDGGLSPLSEPGISTVSDLPAPAGGIASYVIGSACHFFDPGVTPVIDSSTLLLDAVRPSGATMAGFISNHVDRSQLCKPHELTPAYVQQDIGWKKLSEQPRRV